MRICLDLDGCVVMYDFPTIVKNFFGVDLSPSAIFAYDLADVLGVAPALINTMFKEQVYGKPKMVECAVETLESWKDKGYELIIFSNRIKYMGEYDLARWLIEWEIPFSGIDGGQGEYTAYIDDSPSKLMATNSLKKLLFNQPWNKRCLDITNKLVRVNNWQEIKREVDNV